MLLAFVVIGMVIFFRVYRLESVPPQMNSDHAEKLLDVWDVLNGQYNIFFPRNTGREDFQMYLTATIVEFFDTGISFMSLKIGTVLAGLLTLPYIYLLGKEIGGKRAGWLALLLAGIAYWPNVISRIGLRFTLYSLFTAPTLYYLIRGLHRRRRNDLLLSGLFLGLGLHGYSPFRVVPIVVLAAFGIYFLHRQSKGARRQVFWWLAALVAISIVVFLPLLRFALENPDLFSSRMFSRMGSIEQPLPGPAGIIFLQNLWRALVMFFWENGEVWVVSVPYRPALDIVSAPLFFLGMILLSIRYIRQRYWVDLFLLISIPLLMLPSILALAFPSENPILNRTAGALVPVFVIAGIGLDRFIASLEKSRDEVQHPPRLFGLGNTVLLLLIGMAALHNYDLVFHQYQRGYELSSWNTTEMGQVIRTFGQFSGTTETAWVVAYPHWVDTRLVGINAGMPTRDLAIWPDRLAETQADLRPKLFLVKPEDQAGLDTLRQLYPLGILQTYDSPIEGKDFLMFLVPAR
jgi:4-amino-4-deoxy-L-arabinose transferase-like glycosyltransferase